MELIECVKQLTLTPFQRDQSENAKTEITDAVHRVQPIENIKKKKEKDEHLLFCFSISLYDTHKEVRVLIIQSIKHGCSLQVRQMKPALKCLKPVFYLWPPDGESCDCNKIKASTPLEICGKMAV